MDVLSEAKSRPLSTLSVFSYIPPRRTDLQEMRYFNTIPKVCMNAVLQQLADQITDTEQQYPDSLIIILVDFNKAPERSLYDCLHQSTEGYDNKLHRDDRKHAKARGLDIFKEESSRPAPVLSSSVYGRFSLPLNHSGRNFGRVAQIRSDFYCKNGITWTVEEGYGSVTPI